MAGRNYLVFFTGLCLSLQLGVAIRCYECNSGKDDGCTDDHLDSTWAIDCSTKPEGSKYILCRKITQWIDFELNGMTASQRIIRMCGWDDNKYVNDCYYRGGYGARQNVCTCDSDECNSATTIYVTSATILLTTGAILYRYMF